jgi:hypothetical protein
VAAVVVALSGPAAYSLATASTAHSGAIPSAGPAGAGLGNPGGFGPGRGLPPFARGAGGFAGGGGFVGPTGGGFLGGPGGTGGTTGAGTGGPAGRATGGGFPARGAGGLLNGSSPSTALTATLEKDASRYEWAAAAVGSNEAAGYQLATGRSVMPIGGFNGTDPSPTLAQFERLVAEHKIHYFIAGGLGGGGASSTATAITSWVETHFASTTVGGVTLYDLTSPIS